MDNPALVDVLRGTSLFAGFTETELDVVPKVGRLRNHDDGEHIVRAEQGTPRTMWVVIEGEVVVRAGATVVCTLGPGDYFGEMALLASESTGTSTS